jgi:hypothetical protein
MYEIVEAMRARLPGTRIVGYGHVGDGNLHLNVSSPRGPDAAILAAIEPFIYEWTRDARGSISAEHGLGLMKAAAVGYSKSAEAIGVMRQIKHLFDPNGASAALLRSPCVHAAAAPEKQSPSPRLSSVPVCACARRYHEPAQAAAAARSGGAALKAGSKSQRSSAERLRNTPPAPKSMRVRGHSSAQARPSTAAPV